MPSVGADEQPAAALTRVKPQATSTLQNSLKALDLNRPIREADIAQLGRDVG